MSSPAPAAQPAAAPASPQLDGNAAYVKALGGDKTTKLHTNEHLTNFAKAVQQLPTEQLVECVNDCNSLIQGLLSTQGAVAGQNAELLADVLIQLDVLQSGLQSAGSSNGANFTIHLKQARFDQANLRKQLTEHFTNAAQQESIALNKKQKNGTAPATATATTSAGNGPASSKPKKENETQVSQQAAEENPEQAPNRAQLVKQSEQLLAELKAVHKVLGTQSSGEKV